MTSVKRRRDNDETPSPPTLGMGASLEAPVDRGAILSWLAQDGAYFCETVDRMLRQKAPDMSVYEATLKNTLIEGASKEICDTLLGPDRDRVLANLADLRARKGLDREDFVLEMFVDPLRDYGIARPSTPHQTDLVRDAFTDAVVASWGEQYHGDACTALWNYICYNFRPNVETPVNPTTKANKPALENTPTGLFYAHYIVLFQSSGTGKSRLIDELAKMIFLIPICLRGESTGYPPADVDVRAYLNGGSTRTTAYARCWGFMQALFRHTAEVLSQGEFKDLDYAQTASLFRTRMTENMKKVHNAYRQNFFKEVIEKAEAYLNHITAKLEERKKSASLDKPHVSPKDLPRDEGRAGTDGTADARKAQFKEEDSTTIDSELLGSLLRAWSELNNVLEGKDSGRKRAGPRVLLSFDESHDLTEVHKATNVDPYPWSAFGELRATLRALNNCSVFSIFLSTTGRFSQFTPLSRDDTSSRVYNHSLELIPPYCDVGLDVLALAAKEKLDLSGKWTLRRVVDDKYMTLLGRPMFGLMYQRGNEGVRDDLLQFAKQKLTNQHKGVPLKIDMDQATACLGFRLPFEFLSTTYISKDKEFKQVEGHLRICLKPNTESESMVTISPSEPFVSEAAASLLRNAQWDTTGEPVNPIEILKELMTGFSINAGDRGEFVALLLLTLARDRAVLQADPSPPAKRIFFLNNFMRQLIAPGASTDALLQQIALDFPGAVMHFNHFIKPHQQKIIHRDFLLLLMGRGAGFLCATNTTKVDIAVPFLVENDVIHPSNVGAILFQIKNDKKYTAQPQPGRFKEMDPRKIGFLREGDPAVPLIKVFMTFSSIKAGVTIVRHKPTAAYNAVVYDIWIAGLSHDIYVPIAETDQSIWLAALAATRRWESIYRVPRQAPEMRAVRQSTHAGAADNVDHWCRWVDLATTPLELSDGNDTALAEAEDADDDARAFDGDEIGEAPTVQGQSKASTSGLRAPQKKRAKRS
ncbi:hypothetical protein HGRIS_014924 [Hohenbuehelia grisea]|uniref:Uncharacterized protein n=1 Tax=Hohenbuehelia grisea TaxID=104357 RepID=A0ABR3JD68_9AGAR